MTNGKEADTGRYRNSSVSAAVDLISRSNAVGMITAWQREDGIAQRPAIRHPQFTLQAVLVAMVLIPEIGVTTTVREILRTIYSLTDLQLSMVGMAINSEARAAFDDDPKNREEARFRAWLQAQVTCIDSFWDLPARTMSNGDFANALAARTPDERALASRRNLRAGELVNSLIAASIDWPGLARWRGDMVADETILDLAAVGEGMGSKPDKIKSAVSRARFYIRQDNNEVLGDGASAKRTRKMAFGIGVTAVMAVGPIREPGAVPRTILAVEIGGPTSGDAAALMRCLERIDGWPQTPKPRSRQRNRLLGVDMGYRAKPELAHFLLTRRIDRIHRYPKSDKHAGRRTTFILPSVWPTEKIRDQKAPTLPGPVLAWGDFYCPAAMDRLAGNPTHRIRQINEDPAGLDRYDKMLAERLPFVMGRLDRPRLRDVKRAARLPGEAKDLRWKCRLQCPAEQGRVRCPLKPHSLDGDHTKPLAAPDWDPSRYQSCQSEVTVTLSERQLSSFQPGPTPGSFEYQSILDTYRSRTESRFAHLKHPCVTALKHTNVGPRREPLLMLQIGIAVAVSNLKLQQNFKPDHADVIERNFRITDRALGRKATRKPYRS